jgi:hypothetical protein
VEVDIVAAEVEVHDDVMARLNATLEELGDE